MSVTASAAGDLLGGRYQLDSRLPEVGLGEAWTARDRQSEGLPVMLMLLGVGSAGDVDDPRSLPALVTRLKRLDHPGVLRVRAWGESDGRLYVAYERPDGRTLAGWLAGHRKARTRPAIATAQRIVDQVAAALEAAQQASAQPPTGHGALSPRGVVMKRQAPGRYETRVLDFGVASLVVPPTGEHPAEPAWRAPEQRSNPGDETPRTDVFALAVLLAEVLGPSQGAGVDATWSRLALESPARVRAALGAVRSDVPPAVWDLVARALHADPAQRFEDPAEFRAALQQQWKKLGLWEKSSLTPEAEPPVVPVAAEAPAAVARTRFVSPASPAFVAPVAPPVAAPPPQIGPSVMAPLTLPVAHSEAHAEAPAQPPGPMTLPIGAPSTMAFAGPVTLPIAPPVARGGPAPQARPATLAPPRGLHGLGALPLSPSPLGPSPLGPSPLGPSPRVQTGASLPVAPPSLAPPRAPALYDDAPMTLPVGDFVPFEPATLPKLPRPAVDELVVGEVPTARREGSAPMAPPASDDTSLDIALPPDRGDAEEPTGEDTPPDGVPVLTASPDGHTGFRMGSVLTSAPVAKPPQESPATDRVEVVAATQVPRRRRARTLAVDESHDAFAPLPPKPPPAEPSSGDSTRMIQVGWETDALLSTATPASSPSWAPGQSMQPMQSTAVPGDPFAPPPADASAPPVVERTVAINLKGAGAWPGAPVDLSQPSYDQPSWSGSQAPPRYAPGPRPPQPMGASQKALWMIGGLVMLVVFVGFLVALARS